MASWLSRTLGGQATDTDDDINETIPFPRAERHQPSSLMSENLPAYKGSSGTSIRRTWDEGKWVGGGPKQGRTRSVLANTLIIVLLVAALPLIYGYLKYGDHLATFGDHSSMLPWLSARAAGGDTTRSKAAQEHRPRVKEIRRADEQRPWYPAHAKQSQASKAVMELKKAEHALVHDAQGGSADTVRGEGHSTLSSLAKTLLDTTASARAALGGASAAPRTVHGGDKPSEAMLLKYKAAEREVHALEGKVSYLERKVVQDRVHERDSQASSLLHAESEIARLQKTLTSLEGQADSRGRRHHEERKRIAALEKENLRLERAVVDKRQEKDEISKLTDRVQQLSRDEGQRTRAARSGELAALHSKLAEHLTKEEARVKALMANKVRLAAQLEAADSELTALRKSPTPLSPATDKPSAPPRTSSAFSPPPVPSTSSGRVRGGKTSAVDKLVAAASSPAADDDDARDAPGQAPPLAARRRKATSHRVTREGSLGSEEDERKYRGLDYQDEVQAKENAEEKRISRQAGKMLSRRAEQVGLDARHREMLRHLEHQKSERDLKADQAADRDLAARQAEINAMLGSNSACPGPGCMRPRGDPAVRQATSYASRRFAPQSY